jgi:L-lysine exporter family protein LysE/ArgO
VAPLLLPLLVGFGTGISLIAAIGAQNAFVLRQGLRREHVLAVASFCSVADLVLVTAAIGGVGAALTRAPGLLTAARVLGVVYLVGYAAVALRRAWRPGALVTGPDRREATPLRVVLGTCAAMTLLNPHLYLDVLMLGSIANSHPGDGRWLFGAGVVAASVTWFFSLACGARRLSGVFARPKAWRILDTGVAAVMLAIATTLAAGFAAG